MNILFYTLLVLGIFQVALSRQFPKTKGEQACVHQCGLCFELYGCFYDGRKCTNECLKTNGASIDQDCQSKKFHRKSCKKMDDKDEKQEVDKSGEDFNTVVFGRST